MEKTKRKPKQNLNLWKVSAPWLIMVLIGSITTPINTMIVSHLGTRAIEVVGTSSGVLSLFRTLMTFVSGGVGILIGKYIGKKKEQKDINELLDSSIFIVFLFSLFIGIILIALPKYFLMLWSIKENTLQMTQGILYIRVMSSSIFLFSIGGVLFTAINAYGYALLQTIIGMTGIFLDILFSFVFVYFTNMGIISVAIGTLVSKVIVSMVVVIIYHCKIKNIFTSFKPSFKKIKKIIKISGPIAGEKVSYNGTQFVLGVIVGATAAHIGLIVAGSNLMLASRAIFLSIQGLVTVFSVAISIGLEVIASRLLASGKIMEAKKMVKKAFIVALMCDLILVSIVALAHNGIINLMMSNDNLGVKEQIKTILFVPFMILIPLQFGRTMNLIYIASTRSAGDVRWTFLTSISISWLLICLASFIFAYVLKMGMTGIVLAMALDEVIRGGFNFYRWKSNKWKRYI